jgi:uncharacterized protein
VKDNINFIKFLTILYIQLCISTNAISQNTLLKKYYDVQKKQLKEAYKVNDHDTTILDGIYKNYYQNGKIKTVGFYTNNQATDYWEYFYQNGNLKMEGLILNFFNEGHWIYYFENGNKSSEGKMEKGKKNGYWKYYYENGSAKSEGEVSDGKLNGEWLYYYEDATFKAKANYKFGTGFYTEFYPDGITKMEGKIKAGKSDSVWNYYYPNGQLKAYGEEKNGLKEGFWRFFNETGVLTSEGRFSGGVKNGKWRYYNEVGKLSSGGLEKNGQKEGHWSMFYDNGKLKGEGNFTNGDGEYTEYYNHGKIKVKGQFRNGKHEGLWHFFLEDGAIEGTCEYFKGEGWYKGVYPNGKMKMEGFLKDGLKTGVWRLYKSDGSIAGFYKTFRENTSAESKHNLNTTPDSLVLFKKKVVQKRNTQTRRLSKFYFYKPDPNLFKTFILSFDAIGMLQGGFPLALEYYVQDRWGLVFGFTYLKSPLFVSPSSLPLKTIYQNGLTYSISYRKYFYNKDFIGRPFIAGETRFKNLAYNANINGTSNSNMIETISLSENTYELNLIIGDRFLRNYAKKGWTFDVYFGLGVSFSQFNKNYVENANNDAIFNGINGGSIYIPLKFGLSLGYAF